MHKTVVARVAALPKMNILELKKLWKDLFRTDPPPLNKPYYVKRLAYRLQELAYGVDKHSLEKRLETLSKRGLDKPAKSRKRLEVHRPVSGTQFLREYNGIEHVVTVLNDGFDYSGQKYTSLSAIARKITGTRWNGLVFFGVKRNG